MMNSTHSITKKYDHTLAILFRNLRSSLSHSYTQSKNNDQRIWDESIKIHTSSKTQAQRLIKVGQF